MKKIVLDMHVCGGGIGAGGNEDSGDGGGDK